MSAPDPVQPNQTCVAGAPGEATSLAGHMQRTIRLAWPIVIARSMLLVMFVVDTMSTGWVSGREVGVMGLGISPMLTLMLIGIGALQPAAVLAAQALGAREPEAVGTVWRTGLLHGLVIGLIVVAISLLAEPFLLLTGQEARLAHDAAEVSVAFALGVPGMLMFIATNMVLEVTGRPKIGMVLLIGMNLINIGLDIGLVAEGAGADGSGAAFLTVASSSALRWLGFAVAAYALIRVTREEDAIGVRRHPRSWPSEWRGDGASLGRRMRRIGLPMGLAQGVESAAFATVVMLAGHLGEVPLAAHQSTLLLVTLAFMMALGISGATQIRVGSAIGSASHDPRLIGDVGRAGWTGIGLSALLALVPATLFFAIPGHLAAMVVVDPDVRAMASGLIRIAALFVLFDAMMVTSIGALRGAGDVWLPVILQASAFWAVLVPSAWFLAFHMELGAEGLIWAIFAGLVAALTLLLPRFARVARHPPKRL